MTEPLAGQAIPTPVFRELRVFAVDPGMTARFETAVLNEKTVRVPWEELQRGPVGEYVEVVDEDERGRQLHPPVDLDRPELLAQHGFAPSDGNPQFRQQMLYAVAMNTIGSFERALGRVAHWAPTHEGGQPAYRRRLALYPHYTAMANAYYTRDPGLCLGYFEGPADSPLVGTVVFSCLSQDVITHELTHALLDGMDLAFQGRSDDLALEEAFADLIALFQHFGDGDVLRAQISAMRGDLDEPGQLGAVGLQFGQAMGKPDGLRNALGSTGEDGRWRPRRPDPQAYRNATEAHGKGDVLVGAVFEAFRKIYTARVADLRRIASRGTGILAAGHLHPDLVRRLSREAAATARLVQQICLRALDYLPPVDVTFGDFLRALVTADYDLFPEDARHYRIAFLDAFRSYGILPTELATVSADTAVWPPPSPRGRAPAVTAFVRELSRRTTYWNLPTDRRELWEAREGWKRDLIARLEESGKRVGPVRVAEPFEVRSMDLRRRSGPAGSLSLQWVVKLVQNREGRWVGCTLLLDAESGRLNYLIAKPPPSRRREGVLANTSTSVVPPPAQRRLRVFASDPSLGTELATAGINEVTVSVPWERDAEGADVLGPGPAGEYVEIVDHDPASDCFYAPVDLNHRSIVAQQGLPPSESNPQFHQQMVYAVTMRIIRDFELALGRLALWSPHRFSTRNEQGKVTYTEEYVPRLRIHPHALREANAYYSPSRKALLFGYFPAPADPAAPAGPRLTVFTCLSHDIVAHEVTHALLDGIHRRFNEPSNPDVLAFHEAFADIVALFEHFSMAEVLEHQIAATRGDLASQNRLGELAQQFGRAIGRRGALRSAIGSTDPSTGQWSPNRPDPGAYQRVTEPHERGAILVAAVFDAFLTMYKDRVADLLRIATEGTGVLPAGQLHPDLVNRLAKEAAVSARRVLHMCIRALDYCPPVDVTFGDYLRAVITSDFEFDPVDELHDRVAFVEAFRRFGIVPEDVRTLSPDGLLWRPASAAPDGDEEVVVGLVDKWSAAIQSWHLTQDRRQLYELTRRHQAALHSYLTRKMTGRSRILSGIDPERPFEVHSIRPSAGTDWNGTPRFQWVIELTQRAGQYLDPADEARGAPPDFYVRGGCTLLVDARTGRVRYSIKKRLDPDRCERQYRYLRDQEADSLAATYFGETADGHREPFAMLHRM